MPTDKLQAAKGFLATQARPVATFGETLKRERELREISLREISTATKINIRYLEALEQNRFEALPGGLFNKGFIRAYARFIGIDGEAMVNSYLHDAIEGGNGPGPAVSAAPPGVHRPLEVPRRRAVQGNEDAFAVTAPAPSPKRPGGIDDAIEPPPSRALLGIATLVAGTALVFVLFMVIARAVPLSARRPAAQDAAALDVRLEVTRESFVRFLCDGREALARNLRQDEIAAARCLTSLVLDAEDAGAVRLFVNGVPCPPIGADGGHVLGYTIRSGESQRVCAASDDGGHGGH